MNHYRTLSRTAADRLVFAAGEEVIDEVDMVDEHLEDEGLRSKKLWILSLTSAWIDRRKFIHHLSTSNASDPWMIYR